MNYPTFETKYGQLGAAQPPQSPGPLGAAGIETPESNPWAELKKPQEQENMLAQRLDPWAIEQQNPVQNQGGKK